MPPPNRQMPMMHTGLGPMRSWMMPPIKLPKQKQNSMKRGHQVDRSGLPAEEVDGRLLEHAPDVQDAHAQLDHQTANDGGQHLGLTGF